MFPVKAEQKRTLMCNSAPSSGLTSKSAERPSDIVVGTLISQWNPRGELAWSRLNGGMLNTTWLVNGEQNWVVQVASLHSGDHAETSLGYLGKRLLRSGVLTPVIVPSLDGRLSVSLPCGKRLRVFSYISHDPTVHDFTTVDVVVIGEFAQIIHSAFNSDTPWADRRTFRHLDAEFQMSRLKKLLRDADQGCTSALGKQVLAEWDIRRAAYTLLSPTILGHGDLRVENMLFRGLDRRPFALLDFDTVGEYRLLDELGDLARSLLGRRARQEPASGIVEHLCVGYSRIRWLEFAVLPEAVACSALRLQLSLCARYILASEGIEPFQFGSNDPCDHRLLALARARSSYQHYIRWLTELRDAELVH